VRRGAVTVRRPGRHRSGTGGRGTGGTYVTVHAYSPASIQQAIAACVPVIDHGHLADDATVKLMAAKGIWWSLQPFLDDEARIP